MDLQSREPCRAHIKWLIYLTFAMFAMSTNTAFRIIPRIIEEFHLIEESAVAFHFASLTSLVVGGMLFGFFADRLGRKQSVVIGLAIFTVSGYLFAMGNAFSYFLALLLAMGFGIAFFKTGVLAMLGNISNSTDEHTRTMCVIEGFFGVGSIAGTVAVSHLLDAGVSWKWLYMAVATTGLALLFLTAISSYPAPITTGNRTATLRGTLSLLTDRCAVGFSLALLVYVAVENAVSVHMPSYIAEGGGAPRYLVEHGIMIYLILWTAGRFLGYFILAKIDWKMVAAVSSLTVLILYTAGSIFGAATAAYLFPLSGLFLSVLYPTINSKGICCFPKSRHGSIAGMLLSATCLGAIVGPFWMDVAREAAGGMRYGFILAAVYALVLFGILAFNLMRNPAGKRLAEMDASEYSNR